MSETKNLAASIQSRLKEKARSSGQDFNELLHYYSMERFLYRLAQSRYCQTFVLKGALMFLVWGAPLSRPTRDIDLLGFSGNAVETLVRTMQEICLQAVEPDGITFDPDSVKGERIKEDADYEGTRIRLRGTLGKARLHLQIDIGFADVISPGPLLVEFPTILSQPAPQLQGYPRETVVAEKLEAMVHLGRIDSRMKDFYDIWLLANTFEFAGVYISNSIRQTFELRRTTFPKEIPTALSGPFAREKQGLWEAFCTRYQLKSVPRDFEPVVDFLRTFLWPVFLAFTRGSQLDATWKPGGPWKEFMV
jgi:hypothetical protein